ncbi:hypothetical protein ONZ45_g16159 [Pleurotus djamor]|nr:hypothetical protein ONZ45_g16159 [Pleurotus djamor]
MKPVPQCPTNITAYDPGNIIIGLGISVAVLGAACVVLSILVAYIAREWWIERRRIERQTLVPVQTQGSFDNVTGAPSGTHHFDVEKATTSPMTVGSTPELPHAGARPWTPQRRVANHAVPDFAVLK